MTRAHFDSRAQEWDQDPDKVVRAQAVADTVRAAVPLEAGERVLEYGAGTGLVAQALAGHVGPLTLADSSAGMRQVAEEKVAAGALPPGTRVWGLDLADRAVSAPAPDERFDLVVTSLVLHHIPQLSPVLSGFHALLEVGGHVAIADLDAEDGSFHSGLDGFDGHDGFERRVLSRQLEEAGFADVRFTDCTTIVKDGQEFSVFLAVARRV